MIAVICDDPRHARGKVAKIRSFERYEADWVDVTPRRAHLHPGEPPTPWRPNVIGARQRVRHRLECNLCAGKSWGAPLECTDETLKWLLDTVAELGVSTISVHALRVIASRK